MHDSLGLIRSEFPHTFYGVAGTQVLFLLLLVLKFVYTYRNIDEEIHQVNVCCQILMLWMQNGQELI